MAETSSTVLRYQCPQCRAHLTAQVTDAGRRRECTSCGKVIKVPGAVPPSSSAHGKAPVADIRGTTLQLECPACRESLVAGLDQIGTEILCENCLESVPVLAPNHRPPSAATPAGVPPSLDPDDAPLPYDEDTEPPVATIPAAPATPVPASSAPADPDDDDAPLPFDDDDPLSVNDDPLPVNDDPLSVNDDPLALNDDPLALNDDPLALNDDLLPLNDDPLALNDDPLALGEVPLEDEQHAATFSHAVDDAALDAAAFDDQDDDELILSEPVERTGYELAPETVAGSDPLATTSSPDPNPASAEDGLFEGPSAPLDKDEESSEEPEFSAPAGEFAVPCGVCGTRVFAIEEEIGSKKKCPDCFSDVVVRPPRKQPPRFRPPPDRSGDNMGLSEPVPRQTFDGPSENLATSTEAQDAWTRANEGYQSASEIDRQESLEELAWLQSLFGFLIDRATVPRWIVLSLFAFGWFTSLDYAYYLSTIEGNAVASFGTLVCVIIATLLGIAGAITLGVSCLVIVADTSDGHEKVTNWPETMIFEWVWDSLYAINALIFAALPGFLLSQAGFLIGMPFWLGIPLMFLSAWVFFPVVFLSMLEANSPILPYSPAILKSINSLTKLWMEFYGWSAVLTFAMMILLLFTLVQWIIVNLPIAILLVAGVFVYCRLLGRHARVCSEALPSDEDE